MENLLEHLEGALGATKIINEGSYKSSVNPKDIHWPLTPGIDYEGQFGVIIGEAWNINKLNKKVQAENLIASMGLNIENDLDDIIGYDEYSNDQWENGGDFVYFYAPMFGVSAFVFDNDGTGVRVIK